MFRRHHLTLPALLPIAALAVGCANAVDPTDAPASPNRLEAVTSLAIEGVVTTEVAPVPAVRVVDGNGAPVPGVTVSFWLHGDGELGQATMLTDAAGVAHPGMWRLGAMARVQRLTAAAGGQPVVFSAMARAGPLASIAVFDGDRQTAPADSAVFAPLRVRALDAFGNMVAGAAVTFTVVSGGGSIAADTARAGVDGVATSGYWTLGPAAGPQQVRAQAGTAEVLFTAEACELQACDQLLFVRARDIHHYAHGTIRQLTSSGHAEHPAWSADGRRVAFANYPTVEHPDVYVMDADGTNVTRLTSGSPMHSPSWSPAGDAIVLAGGSWLCVYQCDIYIVQLTATGAVGPPKMMATMGADPAWSPDGSRIAYVGLSGDDGYHTLRVMNADGTGNVEIVAVDGDAMFHPAWSPDGTRIAFSKCLGDCDLLVVNADGSGLRSLTGVRGSYFGATWSRDGTRIAFTMWASAGPSVGWISAEGGQVSTLIPDAYAPAWRR